MKDTISQLMDGELDDRPAAQVIGALASEGEARDAWRAYHLIGDAMRDTRLLSPGFAARVMDKLAAEPTVLSPHPLPGSRRRNWLAVPAAVAAGVAGVAVVGWLALAPPAPAPLPTPMGRPAPPKPPNNPAPAATPHHPPAPQRILPA